MIRGIDVSSAQSAVDWNAVMRSGIRFAYIKCSTGNDAGIDTRFAANVAQAKVAGVVVGAYHFGYPLPTQAGNPSREPGAQAQIAFDKCQGLGSAGGDLPPALDLEWPAPQDWARWKCTAAQIRDWGLAYLDAAKSLWGRTPVVYTYPDFWQHVLAAGPAAEYAAYPLWIADYAHYQGQVPPADANPRALSPWNDWTLWQHDGDGGLKMPNGGDADFNVFQGDEPAFTAFVQGSPSGGEGAADGAAVAVGGA